MVISSLNYLKEYKSLSNNIATAIDFILATDLRSLTKGKYEIAGEDVFGFVNEYETKPEENCSAENHRKYIDIQIIISGEEKFGHASFSGQIPTTPFKPDNDVAFYDIKTEALNYFIVPEGHFVLFFPSDIHKPDMCVNTPTMVKKLVIKIAV